MKAYLAILFFTFALGVALIVASLRYEWYTVPREELDNLSTEISKLPREERFEQWRGEIKKLETPRKKLVDAGSGLATLAAVFGLLFFATKFPFSNAKTPPSRWMFLVLFWVATAVHIPLSFWGHHLRLERYEYPWWSDSFMIDVTDIKSPLGKTVTIIADQKGLGIMDISRATNTIACELLCGLNFERTEVSYKN